MLLGIQEEGSVVGLAAVEAVAGRHLPPMPHMPLLPGPHLIVHEFVISPTVLAQQGRGEKHGGAYANTNRFLMGITQLATDHGLLKVDWSRVQRSVAFGSASVWGGGVDRRPEDPVRSSDPDAFSP